VQRLPAQLRMEQILNRSRPFKFEYQPIMIEITRIEAGLQKWTLKLNPNDRSLTFVAQFGQ
jgi:hypothetical protein